MPRLKAPLNERDFVLAGAFARYSEMTMKVSVHPLRLLILLLFFLTQSTSVFAEPAWVPDSFSYGFEMFNLCRVEENIPDYLELDWDTPQRTLYQVDLALSLDMAWDSLGAVCLILDSGDISRDTTEGSGLENDRSEDYFFQQGYFESRFLDESGIAFKVGQQHLVFGESYILDDFLLAGQVGLDLNRLFGLPWDLYGTVARIRGTAFYSQIKAVRPISPFECFSVSIGWLHDTEGFLAELLEDIASRYPHAFPWPSRYVLRSDADIFWLALSGNRSFRFFSLSATGIMEGGNLNIRATDPAGRTFRGEVPTLGYLVDIQAEKNLTDRLSLEIFWLMASGEGHPQEALRNGELFMPFLSIVPYITRTNIFFNGGISENLSHREFNLAGHTARGFCVPGVSVSYFFTDSVWLEAKAAYLFTVVSPPPSSEGGVYGWEADLMGFWQWGEHVMFSAEADLFLPGSFFARPESPDPDPAYRIMGGIDFFF